MRLFLVIDETRFFHPDFSARLIEKTLDDVVGAALVTKVLPKNNITRYLRKHWYYLKVPEILKLVYQNGRMGVQDRLSKKMRGGHFHSVRSVLRFFDVDFIEVEYNINQDRYLKFIEEKKPDVILSSNSLYFGDVLLRIPAFGCINRHSALLPSYGGLLPVFQAFRSGEKYTGVTVHKMEKRQDRGPILAQRKIEISGSATVFDLYKRCFEMSPDVVLEALEKIRKNQATCASENVQESYFSFPSEEHWNEFRQRKGRLI